MTQQSARPAEQQDRLTDLAISVTTSCHSRIIMLCYTNATFHANYATTQACSCDCRAQIAAVLRKGRTVLRKPNTRCRALTSSSFFTELCLVSRRSTILLMPSSRSLSLLKSDCQTEALLRARARLHLVSIYSYPRTSDDRYTASERMMFGSASCTSRRLTCTPESAPGMDSGPSGRRAAALLDSFC